MSEKTHALNGAVIQGIELFEGDEATVYKGEYSAYELTVTTDKEVLRFAGCHDAGGDVEILPVSELTPKEHL